MLGLGTTLALRQLKSAGASMALSQGEAPDSENESVGGPTLPSPPPLAGEPEQAVALPSWLYR